MKVLFLSADQFEDTELLAPMYRIQEAGGEVDLASLNGGEIVGKHDYKVEADLAVVHAKAQDYDALVLPGGKAPAALRDDESVQALARAFMDANKPVAAICHGPQILVSADVLQGRRTTAYPKVGAELTEAGAGYVDEAVVVDGNLITSRVPGDIPAFNRELIKKLTG